MARTAKTKLTVFALIQSHACDPFYKNGKCLDTFHNSVLADKFLPNLRQFCEKNAI